MRLARNSASATTILRLAFSIRISFRPTVMDLASAATHSGYGAVLNLASALDTASDTAQILATEDLGTAGILAITMAVATVPRTGAPDPARRFAALGPPPAPG